MVKRADRHHAGVSDASEKLHGGTRRELSIRDIAPAKCCTKTRRGGKLAPRATAARGPTGHNVSFC